MSNAIHQALLVPAVLSLLVACGGGAGEPRGDRPAAPPGEPSAGAPVEAPPRDRGFLLFRKGDFKGAEPFLAQALKQDPADRSTLEALGSIYATTDRYRQAEESFRKALTIEPSSSGARLGLAAVLIDTGRYAEALQALDEVRRRDPGNPMALVKGALLEVRRGHPEAAEAAAREAIKRRPEHAEAHYVLGLSLEARGALEEAAAEMRRVLEPSPGHLGALSHMSTIEMRQGRTAEAKRFREAHATALSRQRVEERVRGHRASGAEAFNREDYGTALREFEAVLAEDPDDAQAHLFLGSVYIALGRREDALRELDTSLRMDPHSERALMELGRLQALSGRLDEAIAALRRSIAANPEFAEPHYFLAGIHRARGEEDLYQQEMELFQKLRSRGHGGAMELIAPPSGSGG
jgi:tetratricopeptide (TPR) repeat protein